MYHLPIGCTRQGLSDVKEGVRFGTLPQKHAHSACSSVACSKPVWAQNQYGHSASSSIESIGLKVRQTDCMVQPQKSCCSHYLVFVGGSSVGSSWFWAIVTVNWGWHEASPIPVATICLRHHEVWLALLCRRCCQFLLITIHEEAIQKVHGVYTSKEKQHGQLRRFLTQYT